MSVFRVSLQDVLYQEGFYVGRFGKTNPFGQSIKVLPELVVFIPDPRELLFRRSQLCFKYGIRFPRHVIFYHNDLSPVRSPRNAKRTHDFTS